MSMFPPASTEPVVGCLRKDPTEGPARQKGPPAGTVGAVCEAEGTEAVQRNKRKISTIRSPHGFRGEVEIWELPLFPLPRREETLRLSIMFIMWLRGGARTRRLLCEG